MPPTTPFDALVNRPTLSMEDLKGYLIQSLCNPVLGLGTYQMILGPSPEAPQTHLTLIVLHTNLDAPIDPREKAVLCGALANTCTSCGYDVISVLPGWPRTTMILRRRPPAPAPAAPPEA